MPSRHRPATGISRRRFLHWAAFGGAALALPAPLHALPSGRPVRPVRVRGRVQAGRRGLAGVGVTDGLTVVSTTDDGTFELVTSTRQPFVSLCLPAGYRIPQNPSGTAHFYRPIRPDARGEMEARFDLVPDEAAGDAHAFLVLADPQTQNTYETGLLHERTVPDVRSTVQTLSVPAAFGVGCGDLMFDDLSLFPEYERAVSRMELPFFQVVGNHDLDFDGPSDEASTETFRRHFGPTYYSFDRGLVHYVVLDDVFLHAPDAYIGYLDGDQLGWLAQDLARVEPGRTVVVFVHIPAFSTLHRRISGAEKPSPSGSITNRAVLYRLLEPYEAHVMSGHTHEHEHVFEGGVHEHVHGAVCGPWWAGDVGYDGTPAGYGVYEVRGASLRWRYKATGHPMDYQLRVYARGADPKAPDEIVANVWDWDPEWKVVWYEGGERRGEMARRTGTDPLSERLHRGPRLPERRTWVEPVPTDHLFYAPVSPAASDVRVEATDRWGNVFSATPEAV